LWCQGRQRRTQTRTCIIHRWIKILTPIGLKQKKRNWADKVLCYKNRRISSSWKHLLCIQQKKKQNKFLFEQKLKRVRSGSGCLKKFCKTFFSSLHPSRQTCKKETRSSQWSRHFLRYPSVFLQNFGVFMFYVFESVFFLLHLAKKSSLDNTLSFKQPQKKRTKKQKAIK